MAESETSSLEGDVVTTGKSDAMAIRFAREVDGEILRVGELMGCNEGIFDGMLLRLDVG